MKKIYFTVTNDLTYDQRMHRICTSLAENGYDVVLTGRKLKNSAPLTQKKFAQKRIRCFFNRGKIFYAEYNFRLLIFLLFKKMHAVCAIDLDTIVPCYFASKIKNIERIYDAHELFTELKEVVTRPAVKRVWNKIERNYVPRFRHGYTVSDSIRQEFHGRHGVSYEVIRNMPLLRDMESAILREKTILYQGAVNQARGFEFLIPAMKKVNAPLIICGDGNFMKELLKLIEENEVREKVTLKGMLSPAELWEEGGRAYIGVGIAENIGLNQFFALPNKFFEFIHAGIPQVSMDYPEYRKLNERYETAVLISNLDPETISSALNNLLSDDVLYNKLKRNCLFARQEWNWQQEEQKLLSFYQEVFKVE